MLLVGGLVASSAQAATRSGTLRVAVVRLPASVPARVTVSGAHGTLRISRTTRLRLSPGSYRILARFARGRRGLRYFPVVPSQRVAVHPAKTTTAVADYATIVPPSTHTPPGSAITALSGKDGTTQTLSITRGTAARYRVGDVIAVGVSRRAPNGMIVRVTRVLKRTRRAISFWVTPGTLAQALPRTIIDAHLPAARPVAAIRLMCGSTATATATGYLDMGLRMHLGTGGRKPHLTAASFELTPAANTGVTVTTTADGTCKATRSTASTRARVTVHAGPVPIVLVPRTATRITLDGSYGPGITATTLQTITGSLRLSYDGKSWRRSVHLTRKTTHGLGDSQPAPAAAHTLTSTITPTASILLDGLAGPHVDLSDAPSLSFTPGVSLDLAHETSARDGLERTARPLTGRKLPPDATILKAAEALDHRTLAPSAPPGASATQVAAGGGMTCALLHSGRLFCWGGGTLGNGSAQSSVPALVPGLTDVRAVSTSGTHTCAVLSSGAVECWGGDSAGEIGNGAQQSDPIERPTAVVGIATATQVVTGGRHTCALLADGTVECWGSGSDGQLGNGDMKDSPVPVAVTGITAATQISADGDHSCALLADGTVSCWGHSSRLDPITGHVSDTAVPFHVAGVANATQITAGSSHDCALLRNASVLCWGFGESGQLGNGQKPVYSGPVEVVLGDAVAQVSADGGHTCALLTDDTVSCWGTETLAGVPEGVSATPVPVPGIATALRLSTGNVHACAVLREGAIDCWGNDSVGQLGNGSPDVSIDFGAGTTYASTARVVNLPRVGQVTAGVAQLCAVIDTGGADCWGFNDQRALGQPSALDSTLVPLAVPAPASNGATQISAGISAFSHEDHTCARLGDGTVACWGANDSGQLGNGTMTPSAGPALVGGIATAVQVAAGGRHSCAVLQNGTVDCWGANASGQLGNGTTTPSATPVQVSGITTAVAVAAGEAHACALLQGGGVDCWGDDFEGELGNGHSGPGQNSAVPVAAEIPVANRATDISAGGNDTCDVLQDHTVNCWGNAAEGQLGNGMKFPSDSSPVMVGTIHDATDVSTGLDYACAVRSAGGVSCWGSDLNGQLGNAIHIDLTTIDVTEPADVLRVTGATHVAAGDRATCATLAGGTAECWGSGTLGDAASNSPLTVAPVIGLPDS